MLQLTRRAVRLPDDLLTIGLPAVLIIEAPKNRRHMGKRQFVLIKKVVTIDWLRWLVLPLTPGQRLFPGSRQAVVLRVVCRVLHVRDAGITPASLRTGGAATHFQEEQNLLALQFHGRWRTPMTLQHYLQEGLCTFGTFFHCSGRHSGVPSFLCSNDVTASVLTTPLAMYMTWCLKGFDSARGYPGEGPCDLRIRLDEVRQQNHTTLSDTGPMGGQTFLEAYRFREFAERASYLRRADPNHIAFAKNCKVRLLAGLQLLEPLPDLSEPPAAVELQVVAQLGSAPAQPTLSRRTASLPAPGHSVFLHGLA
ncbi:unnamed protein product [Polarella glacialis]|uniref:Uncharacterized protein n=1 Tax=Polarella glacialis TaxID=89957 RepID=A0A813I9G0_POLGL|nr:unnamed protein product [Polarella glacialis]CAE8649020.1 unnamed protein product [Polarella glacialis]